MDPGGLSFFQGIYSLACDNIVNHEVVLSNGTILNANTRENADLHKALKGGNNNFGIVTRFDVRAFPQGRIWSGHTYASPGRQNIPNRWFESFASSRNNDLGGMIMYYANYALGMWTNQAFISYVQPQQDPQVYRGLMNASSSVNADVTTMQEVARENAVSTPSGTRSSFSTFTIVNSAAFMDALLDLGQEYGNSLPLLSTMNLIFQPLWTRPRMRSFDYGGGNVLGLEHESRDLVIVLIHTIWMDSGRTEEVKDNMRTFINQAQQLARQMGVYHPYLYLNYAESFQDVMSSYGPESVDFMIRTSQKYDPIQLWQRRVPGGFKLPRRRGSPAPGQAGQYPPPAGQYPPPAGQYPPPAGQYPPPAGQYPPPAVGAIPPQMPNVSYPPSTGAVPPQSSYDPQNQYPPPPLPPSVAPAGAIPPQMPNDTQGQYPPPVGAVPPQVSDTPQSPPPPVEPAPAQSPPLPAQSAPESQPPPRVQPTLAPQAAQEQPPSLVPAPPSPPSGPYEPDQAAPYQQTVPSPEPQYPEGSYEPSNDPAVIYPDLMIPQPVVYPQPVTYPQPVIIPLPVIVGGIGLDPGILPPVGFAAGVSEGEVVEVPDSSIEVD
jgi:hypothetical protein